MTCIIQTFRNILSLIYLDECLEIFFCVGVMFSGEYDARDVTLSVYPHRASLKSMPDHGGNRTYDLWNTSPKLRDQFEYVIFRNRI